MSKHAHGAAVRRRHYIDRSVQGRLLVALVLMEFAVFGAAMLLAYVEMNGVIEANLYKIHRPEASSQPLLMEALLPIVLGIFLINLMVVLVATRFWSAYVNAIVRPLQDLFSRVSSLDMRETPLEHERHEVLALGQRWFDTERQRCLAIRDLVDALPLDSVPDGESAAALRGGIARLRDHLPVAGKAAGG